MISAGRTTFAVRDQQRCASDAGNNYGKTAWFSGHSWFSGTALMVASHRSVVQQVDDWQSERINAATVLDPLTYLVLPTVFPFLVAAAVSLVARRFLGKRHVTVLSVFAVVVTIDLLAMFGLLGQPPFVQRLAEGTASLHELCELFIRWTILLAVLYAAVWLTPAIRLRVPRFSVRCALIVMTCCAVVCAAVRTLCLSHVREKQISRDIEALGGSVRWWSRDSYRVAGVDFSHCPVDDTVVESLYWPSRLVDLNLESTKISDSALKHLMNTTTELTDLILKDTNITDGGMVYLQPLTSLRYLDVRGTHVSRLGALTLQQALPNVYIMVDGVTSENQDVSWMSLGVRP